MRLVSYFGPEDAGTGLLVGDRVVPLLDGSIADYDLDPEGLEELARRATALDWRDRGPARRARHRGPDRRPGQDRVRRPELPRARCRGRPGRTDAPAPVLQVRQRGDRGRRGDRPAGGHRRPRSRGRARRRHRDDRPPGRPGERARPRRRLRRRQRRQRARLAGRPGRAGRRRDRRRPVAAGEGLRHLPADGLGVRHGRRDPRPAAAPPPLVAHPRAPGRTLVRRS